jgi:hypothetical protein
MMSGKAPGSVPKGASGRGAQPTAAKVVAADRQAEVAEPMLGQRQTRPLALGHRPLASIITAGADN